MLNKNRLMAFVALITLMAPIAVGCGKRSTKISVGTAATMVSDCGTTLPGVPVSMPGVELMADDLYHFTWSDQKNSNHSYKIFLCDQKSKVSFEYITVIKQSESLFRAAYVSDSSEVRVDTVDQPGSSGQVLNFDIGDVKNGALVDTLTPYIQAI